jgi:cytoskeletal protein CcmA (bactofilin family)
MQPVVRSLSDVARPTPAGAAGGSYRPSPVAEFNRGASSRPSQESRQVSHNAGSANSNDKSSKSTPRILTVGNDILLKGEIATCDRVVIEGRVEAKLSEVHTVEIAGCGSFKGTAEVEDAEVSGLFEGDLAVKNRLVIYSTGEVRGNVTYGEIEVERGGKLTGQIKTVSGGASATGEKPTLLDVLDIKSRSAKEAAEG